MSIAKMMANDLALDQKTIFNIASASNNYRKIVLPDGRAVWQPAPRLKILQYWVVDYLSEEGPNPACYATAYEPGSSVRKNALYHVRQWHMLRMDIAQFFPSVKTELIYSYLNTLPLDACLDEKDKNLIIQIVSRNGGLVMGAPSSPMLANRALIDLDNELAQAAAAINPGIVYSRYSDDLAFSSKGFIDVRLEKTVECILQKYGFSAHREKTRWMGRGANRMIAGVAFDNEGNLSLGKKRKAELKRMLYDFALNDEARAEDAEKLLGFIMFAKSIDPHFVDLMLVKYSTYGKQPTMVKINELLKDNWQKH